MTDKPVQPDPIHRPRRRRLIQAAGAGLVTAPALLSGIGAAAKAGAPAILKGGRGDAVPGSLFTLGVASGEPGSNSVMLWTRLAPEPLSGGGMPGRPVPVRWQVATDPAMIDIVRSGGTVALPRDGHAVRVIAAGLPEDSRLYYRFHALGQSSRIGRTRTFPRAGGSHMRFAFASCQNYTDGFYPAWRDVAELAETAEDIDFVIHTGDYIYENGPASAPVDPGRNHPGGEIFSVEDYRNRYALYRLDADLQDAHAAHPFLVTWDDHEVDNNYAGLIAEEGAPAESEAFAERRRNAYRVYAESMPLRRRVRVDGTGGLDIVRRLRFGDLADIHMLDTRQFRSDQPCDDGFGSLDPDSRALEAAFGTLFCPEELTDEEATMLGAEQEAWLARNLARSRARWNVLAQQIMVTRWNLAPFANALAGQPGLIDTLFNVDAWDGYLAAQRRLQDMLARLRPNNPVILTGDIHSAWGANILADFEAPDSDLLAAEFVCTSIASDFGGLDPRPTDQIVRLTVTQGNPQIEFFNGLFRGYCLCDVDETRWRTLYRAVGTAADALDPDPLALVPQAGSPIVTDAVLEIPAGFNRPHSNRRLETKFAQIPL